MRLASRTITVRVQSTITRRQFSQAATRFANNRIYPTTVRNEDELQTLLLTSASTRTPLITLWMTNWCQSCKAVSPLVRQLIQEEKVGEAEGGVSFVEIEMDSPDLGGVGGVALRYGITSIPTLLAFDRQEPQIETKLARLEDLKSKVYLTQWIKTEAARHGQGGAGGSFKGLFGKIFGG